MRRFSLRRLLILLFLTSCHSQPVTYDQLNKTFSLPEFIPSGDGWAEARRRRLLKQFLNGRQLALSEEQQLLKPQDANHKYRRVALVVESNNSHADAGGQLVVSLSLIPPWFGREMPGFADLQRKCDTVLMKTLVNLEKALLNYREIRFEMTEACLKDRLTPRLQEQK